MKRIFKKICSIFLILSIATQLIGCGKKLDINELSLVSAIGVDKTEDGFMITVQVVNPNTLLPNPPDVVPFIVMDIEGPTFIEAFRKATTIFTNKLFLIHMQILVFGEELAKEGIEPYVNFFYVDDETQHDFNVIISKGVKAKDILKTLSIVNKFPALALTAKIENVVKNYGSAKETSLAQIINEIRTEGGGTALTGVEIVGNPDEATKKDDVQSSETKVYSKIVGFGILKNDKLVGWLTDEQSLGYTYIKGKIETSALTINMDDGSVIGVEVIHQNSKVKVKIEDNIPKFTIDISTKVTIGENMSGYNIDTKEFLTEAEEKINSKINTMVQEVLWVCQKVYKTDIFNFCGYIHRKDPKYWKLIQDKYDDIFSNMEVKVTVNTIIKRVRD